MKSELSRPAGFWRTVRLLLGAARKRSRGRQRRQQELLQRRTGRKSTNWGTLGFGLSVLFMIILNGFAAAVLIMAVDSGERVEAERQGKIVVSRHFLNAVREAEATGNDVGQERVLESEYFTEAHRIVNQYGGKEEDVEQKLRDAVVKEGSRSLITREGPLRAFAAFPTMGLMPGMLGSVVLIWWGVMLVFQGEGLELDFQRRRHPMWEWLFSHPVPSGAVFLAEMLSPLAANPAYWGAPVFVGAVYGFVYGPAVALLAAFLIGIPITVAAACLGKALEIAVLLRFPPRSRGAMVGIMSWIGYASLLLFFVGIYFIPKLVSATWKFLDLFTVLPWPWLRLFLGGRADGSFSFAAGLLSCCIFAGMVVGGAVWFSVWGTEKGLSGNLGQGYSGPSVRRRGPSFDKEPLYRKEFLWFIRDRSAIVQTILIPLTVAGFQVFNLRGVLSSAQGQWNYLCGVAIVFGTYFLWVLGPKSLASEGTALWIALTWPQGLESLLKAKAWLWSLISSSLVVLVLIYAAYLFPASIWRIALVGIGWFFFSRSMAEKTVTLVSVTSESGEPQKKPRARQWAAQLGMMTFCVGVLTQQWPIAVMGIVYSYLTAAAMWEDFRSRLPYLYDPWSERVPPPPTLMHAMIAISILVEGGAVITGIVVAVAGKENIAVAQAIAYGICAVLVFIGMSQFLRNREVSHQDVWRWPAGVGASANGKNWWHDDGSGRGMLARLLPLGALGGLVLGLFAMGYMAALQHIPAIAEILRKSQEQMANIPNLRISFAVMAVGFAPFAEEYLFRGLLYRALDREWGGWRAVAGSAAFFAIYHRPLSWVPVALLGATNALLFKKTGRLAPAVVLHMVYNAVVVLT